MKTRERLKISPQDTRYEFLIELNHFINFALSKFSAKDTSTMLEWDDIIDILKDYIKSSNDCRDLKAKECR